MKNLKSKLKLSLCLLILCFSTFAQTKSKDDCENFILITRADLEKCATYKRQNDFLEKEIKFQAIERTTLQDTIIAKDNSITIIKKALIKETESKKTWRKTTFIIGIILFLLLALVIFGHKLAKFIVVFCLFSVQGFAQIPDYRPPFSLNGQKGLSQKMTIDTTASNFSIESSNDAHNIKIPYKSIYLKPGNQFQYLRGDKTWQTLNKAAIGLDNIDNTSDVNKSISIATQTALNLKENLLPNSTNTERSYFVEDYGITGGGRDGGAPIETRIKAWITATDLKSDLNIYNINNTSDADKPISLLTQAAINAKENSISAGTITDYYRGDKSWQTLNKTSVGLGNVENTAISTWTGSANITTIGAATASSLRVGTSTPFFNLFNYSGSPRFSSSSSLDFFSTGTFTWTTTGDLQRMRLTTTGLKIGTGSASYMLDISGDLGYQGLIYVGNSSRGVSMSSGSNGQFLKRNTVTDGYGLPLAVNQWSNVGISDITDLASTLNTYAAVSRFNNVTITDSSSFTHALGTQRIDVAFFEAGLREITVIDWYPDTSNTIKVYLPYRDKTTKYKFTGDVFITKRY